MIRVLVMAVGEPAKENAVVEHGKETKHNKARKMGFVKMIVVDDLSEKTVNYEAKKDFNENVTAISDDWKGYRELGKVIGTIQQTVIPPEKAMESSHSYFKRPKNDRRGSTFGNEGISSKLPE